MKTTQVVQPLTSNETPTTRFDVAPRELLVPNPWNPNKMTAVMYGKAIESIDLYGFIDPLLVREQGGLFQIIDGEHRFRAGCDLGMQNFPVIIIDGLSDTSAKKLTIVMNELHGQADPTKMGDLLNEILSSSSLDDLLVGLPYDESILSGYLGVDALPPLEPVPPLAPGDSSSKTQWVERLFRMPKEVALIVDEAIEKAKDGEEIEAWQALERVAAEYLAS
jgi:ParB-like chromosome segregation protein Spo0J